MVGGGDGVRCEGQWVGDGCFLLYSGWLHMDKCVLATSGRLSLGVDIMTGFSCNDSFGPHHVQTQSHTHTHRQTAAGTLSGEAVFAEITVTSGINPKCQCQFN